MQKSQSAVKNFATLRHGNFAFSAIASIFTLSQLLTVTLAPISVSLAKGSDTWEYQQLAAGLRHGCGFARYIDGACARPEILRTPAYPLFVALFPNWRVALLAQALLCGLVCMLAGIWVGRRWGIRAGVAAQLLIFSNIPSFVLSAMLLSETLFQTVLFLAVLTPLVQLSRARNVSSILACAAISGVLIGCLSLIRPVAIFLAVVGFIPFLFFDLVSPRQKLAAIVLSVGIPLTMILGWSWRNYELTGYFGVSTVSALTFYLYRAGGVVALETGRPLWQVQDKLINDVGAANLRLYQNDVTAPLVSEMDRRALQILASHPWETAVVSVQGFLWLLVAPSRTLLAGLLRTSGGSTELGPGSGRVTLSRLTRLLDEVAQSKLLTALIAFQFLVTAVVWIGALRALLKLRKSSTEFRPWIIYLLSVAMLLLVTASGAEAAVRFRSVTMPLLAIAAAMGYFGESPRPKDPQGMCCNFGGVGW